MRPKCSGVILFLLSVCAVACGSASKGPAGSGGTTSKTIRVVAAENFWGSIAAQLGGDLVKVTNIIENPDADPHDYEPTAADGRAIASAGLVIINGVGYDAWATKLSSTNPSSNRIVLTVGDLVRAKAGGNPHRWYNPDDVQTVIGQLVTDFKRLDPADAAAFDAQKTAFESTGLAGYKAAIAEIKSKYGGTPVGASESIVAMIAPALRLKLLTPPGFLAAVSQGTDPTAADKATIDEQIASKQIKVYIYNSQNATPDVQAQVDAATAKGIAVTTITETMTPAGATFEQWQTAQLIALRDALAKATG